MKNNFVVKCIAIILFAVTMTTLLLSGVGILFGVSTGAFVSAAQEKADNKARTLESLLYGYERELSSSYEGYVSNQSSLGYDFADLGVPWFSDAILYEIRDEKGEVAYSTLEDNDDYLSIHFGRSFSVLKDEYKNRDDIIIGELEEDETKVIPPKNENELSEDATANSESSENNSETESTEVWITEPDITDNSNITSQTFPNTSKYYEDKSYSITVQYKDDAGVKDNIYYVGLLYDFVAENEIKFYTVAATATVISVVLFIIILCIAGHNGKNENVIATKFDKIPHDILTIIYAGVTALLCMGFISACMEMENSYYNEIFFDSLLLISALLVVGVILDFMLLAVLIMTLAVRFKTSTFIKSTVIYKAVVLIGKILKKIWCGFVKAMKTLWYYLRKIPLVWKTVVVTVIIIFVEWFILAIDWGFYWPAVWIINIVLCIAIVFVAVLLKNIKNGTEEIAKGNVYKKIDTKYLFLDLKDHAENINNMSDGIQKAVAEQMKSERFKTELITNVSHDIKTPLTSIINYVDLLEKEEIDNETAKEYIDVLSRQSTRLKKLIDDLLEASKASTGNINVNLMKFELGILLSQALGEYEERFEKNNLQVILNKTDEMLLVMADNRHMWRVFDNVLNNIAKYAQPGTRVYIDAKRNGQFAEISFRNISKEPLNISGDELMERFVRGDSSRNTEGSGLGLSIAKSLTEVQKGNLDIRIDGDLFKVLLKFPLSE